MGGVLKYAWASLSTFSGKLRRNNTRRFYSVPLILTTSPLEHYPRCKGNDIEQPAGDATFTLSFRYVFAEIGDF